MFDPILNLVEFLLETPISLKGSGIGPLPNHNPLAGTIYLEKKPHRRCELCTKTVAVKPDDRYGWECSNVNCPIPRNFTANHVPVDP